MICGVHPLRSWLFCRGEVLRNTKPLDYAGHLCTVDSMTTLYLGYETAQWYWEHYGDNAVLLEDRPTRSRLLTCARTAEEVHNLVLGTPFYGHHLDVLTLDRAGVAVGISFHQTLDCYPARSFIQVAPYVYVSSPELSFVQFSQQASFARTLLYGYALCGSFALDETRRSGTVERARLISARRLSSFVNACARHRGIGQARDAVSYVREGSASPRESKLSLALTLPLCRGGKGLPPAKLNKRIDIPDRYAWSGGRRYYVSDLYWEGCRITAEYDSDVEYTRAVSIYRDSDKRNTLIDMGYTPLCFTSTQLDDPEAFNHAAGTLRRKLGVRRRLLPKNYQAKVDGLRRDLGLSVFPFAPRRCDDAALLDFSW